MKKKIIIALVATAVVISGFFIFQVADPTDSKDIVVPVKSGKFVVDITTTGELEAKNSVKIMGPGRLREFRVYQISIQDIVDEGTVVKKGDWIATLDQSDFNSKLQDKQIDLEQRQSEYIQEQLDTTLQMRQARDQLINLAYSVEEMQIKLDQSQFEPPATIKQAEIDLDKAIRALDQAEQNYKIKLDQNKAKMAEVAAKRRKVQNEMDEMLALVKSFQIQAPEPGMVVYAKGFDGKPIKSGSQIHMWDPVVATLPDLSTMISKTYINEVDVRKIIPGQNVEIGLDAFPEKTLTGTVTRVANVGEQSPNSDSKVFEAIIEIEGTDPLLRPSMTTSNKIIVNQLDSALYIPLEGLHSKADSITFVYKRSGLKAVKQEVMIAETNSNEAVIKLGLEAGDKVYLSVPAGMDDADIAMLKELDGKRTQQEEETTASAQEAKPGRFGEGRRQGEREDKAGEHKRTEGNTTGANTNAVK
ncbi:MAG: HlyD family efflux transporter periplasmic adaptor subunit [Cyclobacteriaceae bacterium]|nr:HlyD family efflux transporter periplasmic adaptor subunit [Cyclobacteriaceae bacterium]